ncbi:MAG: hypothetical protein R3325_04035 [Thermoanaerobaculia bacterium]|nr:hypothetical protein [Thermoanaerobaculia bacterium]
MADRESPAGERGAVRRRFLRNLHERTWELELLLSGAVVFALSRLPAAVDGVYQRLEPGLAGDVSMAAFFIWYYLKLILYTLIVGFGLHLACRAYWVGLVGLDSVFPRGIRWQNLRQGPLARRVYRERLPTLPRMIRVADNVCSIIFSSAFALIAVFLVSLVLAGVVGAVGFLVSRWLVGRGGVGAVAAAVLVVLALPSAVAGLVDRMAGERLAPEGRVARLLCGFFRFSLLWTGALLWLPTSQVLATNVRRRVFLSVASLFVVGLLSFFLVSDVLVPRGRLAVASSAYLPADLGEMGVDYRYYESERPEGEVFPRTPAIPADVVTGPYLRLFIPLRARPLAEQVEETCPEVEPLGGGGIRLGRPGAPPPPERARDVLACLGRLWRVELNGEPLADLSFRFHNRPGSRLQGIVTYLPTAGLPAGENLLTLTETASGDDPPERHFIPFWTPPADPPAPGGAGAPPQGGGAP